VTSGERIYKTGDLAKYKADGASISWGAVITGWSRGFRVELGEIEQCCQHPAIREIVVMAREDVPGDKRLVGYPILDSGEKEPTTSELRSYAHEKLPEYMIPSAFVFLRISTTPNKKIDRSCTRSNQLSWRISTLLPMKSKVSPGSCVLKLERVGIDDASLSWGHSLTQVISRIRQASGRTSHSNSFQKRLWLANIIRKRVEQMDEDKLELLSNLENLSPEEAKALLDSDQ
jgi:nonribosomal peptide synthetase DhbF